MAPTEAIAPRLTGLLAAPFAAPLAAGTPDRPAWWRWLDEHSLATPVRLVLILLVAVAITAFVRRWVRRAIERLGGLRERPATDVLAAARAESRRRTMSAVALSTCVALIWLTAVLTMLSEVGIDLGAFVTGATIIGGAIAFGAQQLVRDVIAGFYVLAEDQYGVGDTVDVGLATGTVERVTLRSVRLRDADGRVWFVPHGNVQRTGNLTQGLVVVNVDVVVPVTTDLAAVEAELARIGADVAGRADLAADVAGMPEVLGVEGLTADAVTIRLTARCRPAAQFRLRRALRAGVADAVRAGRLPVLAAPAPPPPAGAAAPPDAGPD